MDVLRALCVLGGEPFILQLALRKNGVPTGPPVEGGRMARVKRGVLVTPTAEGATLSAYDPATGELK